jgi:hypothetical protein
MAIGTGTVALVARHVGSGRDRHGAPRDGPVDRRARSLAGSRSCPVLIWTEGVVRSSASTRGRRQSAAFTRS